MAERVVGRRPFCNLALRYEKSPFCCMIESMNGIVLRTIKHSDTLMVADILTQQHGRMSFLVPMSKGRRSGVRNVLFQPLSMLSFSAPVGRRGLARLSEVQPYLLYSSIPYDVYKSAMALFLSEFLCAVLREEGENEALFAYLDYAFSWLDEAREGYSDFHIVFLLQLTRFIGIFPNVEGARRGAYFDLAAGCIVGEHPVHGQFLSPDDTANFIELLSVGFDDMGSMALNRRARGQYLALIDNYYRLHVPDFPRLRSAEVLRELFD